MRGLLAATLITHLAVSSVVADVMPPEPRPPPPSSPTSAVVRGLVVEQVYGYWRGRRWLTVIQTCASSQAGCREHKPDSCLIIGVEGRDIVGGDIASLLAADREAKGKPLILRLEGPCGLSTLRLTG